MRISFIVLLRIAIVKRSVNYAKVPASPGRGVVANVFVYAIIVAILVISDGAIVDGRTE